MGSNLTTVLFGTPVTPAQRLAEKVTELQAIERKYKRLANRAKKEMMQYDVQAINLLDQEEDAGGNLNTIQAELRDLLVQVETQRQRMQAYRFVQKKATDLATQFNVNSAAIETQLAMVEAMRAMIRVGTRLGDQKLMNRMVQHFNYHEAQRQQGMEIMSDAVEDAADDTLDGTDVLSGDTVNERVEARIAELRLARGINDMDEALENAPNVLAGKNVLKRAALAVGSSSSSSASTAPQITRSAPSSKSVVVKKPLLPKEEEKDDDESDSGSATM